MLLDCQCHFGKYAIKDYNGYDVSNFSVRYNSFENIKLPYSSHTGSVTATALEFNRLEFSFISLVLALTGS